MIPTQPFGNTGHDSTRIIFGAAAFSDVSQDDADSTMQTIIDAAHRPTSTATH